MVGARSAGRAAGAAVIVLALSGCSPPSWIEATLRDGAVVFVDCEDAPDVASISVYVTPSSGGSGEDVWQVWGEGDFGPDAPITLGVAPEGFTVNIGPKPIDLRGARVSFALSGYAGGVSYTDVQNVNGDDLREGLWLDSEGNLDDEPCQ